ncbi:MAG TPA: FAD-dependent oxidoreductase [Nocardioides sp.]|nr:FAD-dependent oxidoreductase [Nocardioides sp.]
MTPRIIIAGAGLAALRTVEALRRTGASARVTVIGDESYPPYQRPPLSKELLSQETPPSEPVWALPSAAYDDLDVDLRLGCPAVSLHPDAREVGLDDGSRVPWDRLVIATGARARMPAAWEDLPHVFALRGFADLLALRAALRSARRVLVVGAGVLGCEVAAAVRRRGLEVHLVDPEPQPMARVLGTTVGALVADEARTAGVVLHLERKPVRLTAAQTILDDGTAIAADLVVAAVGSIPNTGWLEGSGLTLHDSAVLVDEFGQGSVPGVFGVGDAVVHGSPAGPRPRQEHWTYAVESAAAVGRNLLAAPSERQVVPQLAYTWTDQWGIKIQTLGRATPAVVIDEHDVGTRRLLGLYTEDGRVVGAVGWNRTPQLMRLRRPVAEAWPLHAVRELTRSFAPPTHA